MAEQSSLLCVFTSLRCTLLRYQVEPISTRRLWASTCMNVVMPTGLPDALSITVNGSIAPSLCSLSRRSISAAIQSGCGTFVYHSFHNSPSATASRRSSLWLRSSGASVTRALCSVTG